MSTIYENSLQYDIEQFSDVSRTLRNVENINTQEQPRKVEATTIKKISLVQSPTTLIIAIILVILVACVFYNGAITNEMSLSVTKSEAEMRSLVDEQSKLDIKISAMTDLNKIEKYATEQLGMQKIEKYQISYIDLSGNERSVLLNKANDKNSVSTFLNGIVSSLNVILGYLN